MCTGSTPAESVILANSGHIHPPSAMYLSHVSVLKTKQKRLFSPKQVPEELEIEPELQPSRKTGVFPCTISWVCLCVFPDHRIQKKRKRCQHFVCCMSSSTVLFCTTCRSENYQPAAPSEREPRTTIMKFEVEGKPRSDQNMKGGGEINSLVDVFPARLHMESLDLDR